MIFPHPEKKKLPNDLDLILTELKVKVIPLRKRFSLKRVRNGSLSSSSDPVVNINFCLYQMYHNNSNRV